MNFTKFENLLGKHILETKNTFDIDFENNNDNIYYATLNDYKEFYGISVDYIIVITDERDIINSITIYYNEVVDKRFYKSFISDYNSPTTIQVVEKIEVISKSSNVFDSIIQNVEKRFLKTTEGSFDEKPLYMLWDKKDYQIKILMRYSQNKSEITFRLPTSKF